MKRNKRDSLGIVYLLHFSLPISPDHTCQHYLGYVEADLERRIEQHRSGHGSRLCHVAKLRGITFEVVQTWQGDRAYERRLKRWKNAPKLCCHCRKKI